ncbi:M23 family metallopeptidase [Streptomyces sparsus]
MVNDRPPSGVTTPTGSAHDASYPPYDASYAPSDGHGTAYGYPSGGAYADDPLFGAMPDSSEHVVTATVQDSPFPSTGYDAFPATGTHQDNYGTGGYDTGGFPTGGHETAAPWSGDQGQPHSDSVNGDYGWSPENSGQWDGATGTSGAASYPSDPYSSDPYPAGTYGGAAYEGYDTGAQANTAWDGSSPDFTPSPEAAGYAGTPQAEAATGWDSGSYATVSWEPGSNDTGSWDTGSWDTAAFTAVPRQQAGPEAGAYRSDDGRRNTDEPHHDAERTAERPEDHDGQQAQEERGEFTDAFHDGPAASDFTVEDFTVEDLGDAAYRADAAHEDGFGDELPAVDTSAAAGRTPHPAGGSSRGRRRAVKPRRSALLTVAVPSVAVMSVAGIAAASVGASADDVDDKPAQAAPDGAPVKPSVANSKLDTQLAGLSADAGDFADRASRTQERIDLKERQEAERKRKEAEAIRKEALRPKFALPVAQHGLSAYYGQAGINWMSVHTGIDFPVGYGTPVLAATDGTVSTKWDLAYGNMAIVTAADGTETWYCHLSSTKIRSGPVKAGDTIGYAGSSGNSTGPHLHFEVRPGGGSAVDPVAWFRGKGLDPT